MERAMGTMGGELIAAAGRHDIDATRRLIEAWSHSTRTGPWEEIMERALLESLRRPPTIDPEETKVSRVTQYLLDELPAFWAVREARIITTWGDMLTRVLDQFRIEQILSPGTGWTRFGITGVILSLVAAGADTDPVRLLSCHPADPDRPWRSPGQGHQLNIGPCLALMSEISRQPAAIHNCYSAPAAPSVSGLLWNVDIDYLNQETENLTLWMSEGSRWAFGDDPDRSAHKMSFVPLGQHGRIGVGDGEHPAGFLMIPADFRVTESLKAALADRLSNVLDRVPAELFFHAAGQCLFWPEEKVAERPGPRWTSEAQLGGAPGAVLRDILSSNLPYKKYLRVGQGYGGVDWAGRLLRQNKPVAINHLRVQRMRSLARATSVEDTCRTLVDLFLTEVTRYWVPQRVQEIAARDAKNNTSEEGTPTAQRPGSRFPRYR